MKNILKTIESNLIKLVFIILYSTYLSHTLYAQNNAIIESFKFANMQYSQYSIMSKSEIIENKISEVEEYKISIKRGKKNDISKIDTVLSKTYFFDKETGQITKSKTTSDSTVIFHNGETKTIEVNYFVVHNATFFTKYYFHFPQMMTVYDDSSHTAFLFNMDSLLVREDRYNTANKLTEYIEYGYYKDWIERTNWDPTSKDEKPSSKSYYYFTPDGGYLFTNLSINPDGTLIEYVSLELYNEEGLKSESVSYSSNKQYRKTYNYDKKGQLIVINYYYDDILQGAKFYKYITY